MKWCMAVLLVALLGACAHLPGAERQPRQRANLWTDAHLAFHAEDFRHARTTFQRLTDEFPDSPEGREALFYLGTLSLDPRNPDWDPASAVTHLRRYLALDTARAVIHRRPEAATLVQLAETAAVPAPEAVAGAPATPAPPVTPRLPISPANEEVRRLNEEVETLRRQLGERDETIRRQREELERIRRVLAPRPP